MVVETAKNKIVLNQIVGQRKDSRQVETDVIVNDVKPDILNIISTSGVVSVYKKEIMDGKVRIDGAINTYVIYMADDETGSVRSLNTSLDFTQVIDMEKSRDGMDARINVSINSFDTKVINSRKINIKANIETSICLYSNESIEVVTNVENVSNVQMLNNTERINSLIGRGSNRVSAKDTIAIDVADDLAEIMRVNFKIVDEETKISYNKVLSKADAIVEIMYLTEDNRINTVRTQMPIMGFVDLPNVNEKSDCEVQNNLSNLIVKPNSTEEHSINVEAEIEVLCSAYESQEINIIQDLYSITDDIEFDKKQVNAVTERNRINDVCTIKENLRIPELTGRVFDIQVNPTITNTSVRNGKIIYEGNLNLEILFEQNTGITMRNVDLPFNFDIISDYISDQSNVETILKIRQNDFIVNNGSIEVTIGLDFEVLEQKNKKLDLIENIQMEEDKEDCHYSMIIYFVKPGDTLWKIAKMFKSTVEDIAKINEIEDVNRINVGQQLYIPRFCDRKIAV